MPGLDIASRDRAHATGRNCAVRAEPIKLQFESEERLVNSARSFTQEVNAYNVVISGNRRFDEQSIDIGDRILPVPQTDLHVVVHSPRAKLDKFNLVAPRGTATILPKPLISVTIGLTFEEAGNTADGRACYQARKLGGFNWKG